MGLSGYCSYVKNDLGVIQSFSSKIYVLTIHEYLSVLHVCIYTLDKYTKILASTDLYFPKMYSVFSGFSYKETR